MPYLVYDPAQAVIAPGGVTLGAPRAAYGKTLQAMRDRLHLKLGNRMDVCDTNAAPPIDYSMLDNWINDAYIDLATSSWFSELEGSFGLTTVIGKEMYKLPANVVLVKGMALLHPDHPTKGYEIDKISEETYRQSDDEDGEPQEFFELDGVDDEHIVVLWPTPDSTFSISVTVNYEPVPLTNAAHCPILDRQFHEGIELMAAVKAHSDLKEEALSQIAFNAFTAFMGRRTSKKEERDTGRRPGSSYPRNKYELRHRRLKNEEDF